MGRSHFNTVKKTLYAESFPAFSKYQYRYIMTFMYEFCLLIISITSRCLE